MVRLTDLPDDVLARIFTLLSPFPRLADGALTYAANAFSLALCSTTLLDIFRHTLLTSIDARQFSDEPVSPYFPGAEVRDPYHLTALARLAGPCLQEMLIPEYEECEDFSQWPLLKQLAKCKNLHTLGFHDPHRAHACLKQLLRRVPRMRIVKPGNWTLRHVGCDVEVLEVVKVAGSAAEEVLRVVRRCARMSSLTVGFASAHIAAFIPALVRLLTECATSVQHVNYMCAAAPHAAGDTPGLRARRTGLCTLRVEGGAATEAIVHAFRGVLGPGTRIVVAAGAAERELGVAGGAEKAVVRGLAEGAWALKRGGVRELVLGVGCPAEGVCALLRGRRLARVTITGRMRDGLACAAGLAGVREIVLCGMGLEPGIWECVGVLIGLLRGLRWRRWGGGVRVLHCVGCLQVLDGVWQYGTVSGFGALQALLWELDALFEDAAVEFCGLREGVRRLLEERQECMVVDEG